MNALGFALRATTQQAALRALRFKSGSSSLELWGEGLRAEL